MIRVLRALQALLDQLVLTVPFQVLQGPQAQQEPLDQQVLQVTQDLRD